MIAREVRAIAVEVGRAFNGTPVLLLFTGFLDYRLVRDDGWPWWLPTTLTAASVAIGALLGWHRGARNRKH